MRAPQKTASQNRSRLLFGILLCSLVFLFSTSAKLAGYHHASATTQMKSMKLPLKSLASLEEAAVQMPAMLSGALLLALIVFGVSTVTLVARTDEPVPAIDRWFCLTLAVRPPPSI